MSLYGDDCYFYYYSTCNKGTVCPYRHVPEARGNETSCTLWKAGQCTRPACRYRHMEITVDRSNIPCYWESQPTGCSKPHCPFKHFTEKSIFKPEDSTTDHERSVVAPVNKAINRSIERSTPSPTTLQQQNRSSPKIEPVVVNPFSDDSDEGSPLKRQQIKEIEINKAKTITFKKDADESIRKADVKIKSLAEIRREKEMMRIINDSLEKPLEEDENEPYKTVERPTTVTTSRRIVLDNPIQQSTPLQQAQVKRVVPNVQKTVEQNKPVVQPVKGNIKSRLGRKLPGDKDTPEQTPAVIEKPSLSSRLGLTHKAKENKNGTVSDVKIKSLDEIRAARQNKIDLNKTEDQPKKDTTVKKGIRRITMVDTEQVKPVVKTTTTVADRKKHALESLKATNTQEGEQEITVKKSPEERKRKIRTVKQERAIYVPPGQKSEKSSPSSSPTKQSSISPSKRSRLSTDSETTEDNNKPQGKLNVKTFAELMAEKRKRKEEEDAKEEDKIKTSPKKSRSNFTPIVFDVDQKDKMAKPKVIAATLPFRHKKSALVTPVQNIKQSKSPDKSDINSEIKQSASDTEDAISKDVSISEDVTDGSQELPEPVPISISFKPVLDSKPQEPQVKKSEKVTADEDVLPPSNVTNTVSKDEISSKPSNTHNNIKNEVAVSPSVKPRVVKPSLDFTVKPSVDSTVKPSVGSGVKPPVVNTTIEPAIESVDLSVNVKPAKEMVNEVKTPAPVKRKSSSRESSEKKKIRTSLLSDDDILLDDDDDNNFTLTSDKYDDDDDDILGDIDALLA